MDNTGSGSGTSSTDGQQGEQVTITIDDYLLDKCKSLDDAANSKMQDIQQNTKPRIQKIPPGLFDKEKTFQGFYEPKVVAFGPIHHDNPRLEKGEKVKLKLAAHLDIDREAALKEIMRDIQALKDCYQEDVVRPYSERDLDLAFMFLIDGCAMLHFMEIVAFGDVDSLLQKYYVNYDFIGFAKRDMFLLENQLPFKLLQLLTRSLRSTERAITDINFLLSPCIDILPVGWRHSLLEDPLHLLDLLHSNMTISVVGNRVRCLGLHQQPTFFSTKELRSSGIMLKQSATSSINAVSFHEGFSSATLRLPSITVDDSSTCKLLNLIAYEMCPDFNNVLEVTSYVCFLDSLIYQSEDVRELRQAGILRNHLRTDEDVVELFHKMARGLVPNSDQYEDIKRMLYKQKHKNVMIIRTWVADAKERYFRNPWTFLAVCGAVFGLVLTFIQTWFAVKSYYDRPKF